MGKCKQIKNSNLWSMSDSIHLIMWEIMRFRRCHASYLNSTCTIATTYSEVQILHPYSFSLKFGGVLLQLTLSLPYFEKTSWAVVLTSLLESSCCNANSFTPGCGWIIVPLHFGSHAMWSFFFCQSLGGGESWGGGRSVPISPMPVLYLKKQSIQCYNICVCALAILSALQSYFCWQSLP